MIIKPCVKSIHLEKLEALVRRVDQNHPSRSQIEADYAKRLSGFRGEQSLEYHLSFLPDEEFYLLYNLRLSENNRFFQIDTLLIYPSVIIVLEAKNFRSMLTFDQKGKQLIQTIEETEKGYPCPLIQVSRHKLQLHNWLNSFNFKNIPIETIVVITNPSTILKTIPLNAPLPKNVIRNTMLAEKKIY
ncbi:NERD domain-containing protein [Bacillus luteolus]|uniref:NERD domain-containing protein n=1 Tax=Litchfieldia luteola TaxID=682179 RepID=A0ABR9QFU9_9BACI|nr:nuclease-related domain-containing protein [Cytobacillus luteolus]MBE4907367.1 NERD domain-containing protein [Cytobacillus luteolus]MBP1944132.1 hypothetical protein [Cytobacillus luteolus]